MAKIKSLLTGGAGFIGAHVASELLQMGHTVVVLDDLSGGFKENLPSGVHFVCGSITDKQLVDRLFEEHQFEYVYHLAAYAAEGLSHFIRRFNYENNLLGSVHLINASILYKVKCFVFTSSIAVYGNMLPPMREDTVPEPKDPYGIAKLAVEQDLAAARAQFGLNSIIFRPHNVYGELQNIGDRYRNVVGIFMNQLLKGEPLTIFGDGEQTRAFSYISSVAPLVARSILNERAYGEVFNLGSDTFYSVNALAVETMKAMGIEGKIQYLPERKEAVHAFSDHTKVRAVFGPQPSISLQEGLSKMAQWVKKVGARKSVRFAGIEISEGLPSIWKD